MKRKSGLICFFFFIVCSVAHTVEWMPDPYLERAVREVLDIPDTIPLLPVDMKALTYLEVTDLDIESLKGNAFE